MTYPPVHFEMLLAVDGFISRSLTYVCSSSYRPPKVDFISEITGGSL